MKRLIFQTFLVSLLLLNPLAGINNPNKECKRETAEVNFYVKLDGTDANNNRNQGYDTSLYTVSVFTGHVYTDTKAYKDDKLTLADVFDFNQAEAIVNLKNALNSYRDSLYTSSGILATDADLDTVGINWYVFKSRKINSNPLHVDGQMTGLILVTPTPTPTNTPTPEPTATSTPTPEPTATNTPTPEPTATNTPTPEPTSTSTPTPEPTATSTPMPTDTPVPTATSTPIPEPTATETPVPTATSTPTPMPTATNTPTPIPTEVPRWSITIFLDKVPQAGLTCDDGREMFYVDWTEETWRRVWDKNGINYQYVATEINKPDRIIGIYYITVEPTPVPTITPTPTPAETPIPEITPVPTETPVPTVVPTTPPKKDETPKTGDSATPIIFKVSIMVLLLCLLAMFIIPKKRNK